MTTTLAGIDTLNDAHTQLDTDVSAHALRYSLENFPSGVVAIAGIAHGVKEGLVATSFTVGVSVEPPLVSFAVQNHSRTWPRLRQAQRLGISVLGEEQSDVCNQMASREGDRFAGLDISTTDQGAIFLNEASLWLDTTVYAELPAGDHHIVLLQLHGVAEGTDQPLVRHRRAFRYLSTAEGNE